MMGSGGNKTQSEAVLRALADPERRRALAYLRTADGAVPIPELAAAMTPDTSDDRGVAEEAMTTALYHIHIPKLAAAELVEWARGKQAVRTTDVGDSLPSEIRWLPQDGPTPG